MEFVFIDHENLTSSLADSCGLLRQNRFSVVLDLTWGGWSSPAGSAMLLSLTHGVFSQAFKVLLEAAAAHVVVETAA